MVHINRPTGTIAQRLNIAANSARATASRYGRNRRPNCRHFSV